MTCLDLTDGLSGYTVNGVSELTTRCAESCRLCRGGAQQKKRTTTTATTTTTTLTTRTVTTTTREVPLTTRPAWTAADIRNRTKQGDDAQCYLALFVGEKCQTPGAVYVPVPICCWTLRCKIASGLVFTCAARSVAGRHCRYRVTQDWYHAHQGGKAAITRS